MEALAENTEEPQESAPSLNNRLGELGGFFIGKPASKNVPNIQVNCGHRGSYLSTIAKKFQSTMESTTNY